MSKLGKIIADFDTSITTKIAVAGTTATLLSILDDDGATIANGRYFITIDGDNSSKEHFSCTLTGTSLTVLKSISRKGVESSGAVREHRVGATVTMTNFAHIKFINDLLDGTTDLDGSTPLKYDADPTITDDKHIATKKYADDLAIAGSPNMSTAAKGIAEEATEAEIDADTGAGATAARLAVNPSTLATSKYGVRLPTADEKAALAGSGTPAAGNKYVTEDTDALKELLANKDTDGALAANSDTKYPSQKAVKTYADAIDADLSSLRSSVQGIGIISAKTYLNASLPWLFSTNISTDFWTVGNSYYQTVHLTSIALAPGSDAPSSIITSNAIFSSLNFQSKNVIVEFFLKFAGTSGEQGGFGLVSTTDALSDFDDQVSDAVSFSYGTDGKLYAHTSNAGVGHTETEITGITLSDMNLYRIEWDKGSEARFYVNGVLKATISTTLPDNGVIKFGVGTSGTTGSHYPSIVSEPQVSIELI